jgi:hypothetical protein
MTRRIRWMIIDPCEKGIYDRIVDGINSDQFTAKASSGFLVDSSRGDFVQARFVERNEVVEKTTDPFGNESEIKRTEYTQLAFRLQRQAPQLEIYDAPRQINAFVNRLGEFTKGTAAIYSPEISVNAWLRAFGELELSMVVTGALIVNLELGDSVLAKIALSGERDVRKYINNVASGRKYQLAQALARVKFKDSEIAIKISPEARLSLNSSSEEIESNLRKCLKAALPKGNGSKSS